MKLFLRAQTATKALAAPSARGLPPRPRPHLDSRPLTQIHARGFSGTSKRAADATDDPKEADGLGGSSAPEAKTSSQDEGVGDDAPTTSSSSEKDGSSYTMTKILVAGRSNNEYTSSRTLLPTPPRMPPKVVSVPPNAVENEKFKFSLLRRSRRIHNTEAIISGGASGIGFAVAQRLAAEGVTCTLVGRNEERLKRAVQSLPPLQPPKARPHDSAKPKAGSAAAKDAKDAKDAEDAEDAEDAPPKYHKYFLADVCDPKAWRDLFQQSPNVNYLINAAGITYRSLLAIFPADEIQRVYDVNLYGTTIGCRAALRAWARSHKAHGPPSEKPDRCIVNVSSLLAVQGGYGAAAYAASKAGVVALTRALAQEAANRNVRCNVILPGYIQTQMTESLLQAETIKKIAVKRMGRPDEVADAVTFLIKNKYANNCTLNLDGGTF